MSDTDSVSPCTSDEGTEPSPEALEFADEWSRGMTLHEGSQGWRVVCLLLAEEVRRLTPAGATRPPPSNVRAQGR